MSLSRSLVPHAKTALLGLGLLATLAATGCQVDVGGQTLPSPYWQQDDVQYFPHGPEFKLWREAAAMKQYREEQGLPGDGMPDRGIPADAIPLNGLPNGEVLPPVGPPPAGDVLPPAVE